MFRFQKKVYGHRGGIVAASNQARVVVSRIGASASRSYLTVLYLAELAIFIEVVSHFLKGPRAAAGIPS